ncbi:DUF4815 domain-containing protein [Pseudoalteromonas luteoviolacea]|uniref:DUF4815 domain-containing protein n=1 Tax=Pseudoalteromonas luteoviolacea H33 TaxID=1365251 RepID=A0A167FWJ0_9GAMM|nr:DUF4815 domain-containing protein [Pseudoalteromonas luteoviolacea]KZN53305.1 hypothetical protein N476_08515 [Pseudoalteromonas luteoviolacea H33]KZN76772.1 hypothetical protein N477_15125 [Pseudoalteromonas luteoviolacea H33-S]
MLDDYYEKFHADSGYERLLFRAGKGLQSRELNDLQSQVNHQIKGVADVLLKDGDLVKGGEVIIDAKLATALVTDGEVYIAGQVRPVSSSAVPIDMAGSVDVGVWLTHNVVTEEQDPSLRDPAVDAINFDEPGAARLQQVCQWGLLSDAIGPDDAFYPVHKIEQGTLIIKQPPPQLDAVTQALARYDRESNGGSYVVEGMSLSYRGADQTVQSFSLEEGKAHIEGYEVAFSTSRTAEFDYDPDVGEVKEEPKTFQSDGQGVMRIDTDFFPVKQIEEVNVTVEKTTQLTRGQLAGGEDLLPDDSVLEILSITQGDTNSQESTTYIQGTDFIFLRNHISWQLSGEEPAGGSQYEVTYRYRKQLMLDFDEYGFNLDRQLVDGGVIVDNTLVTIDYQWHRPRIDLIVLDRFGQIKRIKGQAAHQFPIAPKAPAHHLALAQVTQSWLSGQAPAIENLAVRAVSMSQLEQMQNQIGDLYQLLAIERLRNDANSQDPASKYGVFVDPFIDDDMRDAGIAQTAAIVDGELVLPLSADITDLPVPNGGLLTLPYELENVLEQPKQTGSMKINPYQAVEPIPATITLTPSLDHWTQTQRSWTSPITQRFTRGGGWRTRTTQSTQTQVIGRTTRSAELLRRRWVNFSLSGFGEGEVLKRVIFDGIVVTPEET